MVAVIPAYHVVEKIETDDTSSTFDANDARIAIPAAGCYDFRSSVYLSNERTGRIDGPDRWIRRRKCEIGDRQVVLNGVCIVGIDLQSQAS